MDQLLGLRDPLPRGRGGRRRRRRLVARSPEQHRQQGTDVRTGHEATAIDLAAREVDGAPARRRPRTASASTSCSSPPGARPSARTCPASTCPSSTACRTWTTPPTCSTTRRAWPIAASVWWSSAAATSAWRWPRPSWSGGARRSSSSRPRNRWGRSIRRWVRSWPRRWSPTASTCAAGWRSPASSRRPCSRTTDRSVPTSWCSASASLRTRCWPPRPASSSG